MVFLVLSLENAPAWKESSHRLQVHDCQVPDSLRRYVLPAKCIMNGSNNPRSTDSDLIHGTIIALRQVLCLARKQIVLFCPTGHLRNMKQEIFYRNVEKVLTRKI